MARRRFKSDLSVEGITKLQKDLLNYKNDLQKRIQNYVSMLLQVGIKVSQARVDDSPLGKYITLSAKTSADNTGCKGFLIAKGEIKEEFDKDGNAYPPFSTILAIEFGAGIHFNPTPNPNADKFGLGVGTFPGQIHAFEDSWFYWDENEQQWKPTHGVKATMPMYNAQMEMINKAVKIAKRVF